MGRHYLKSVEEAGSITFHDSYWLYSRVENFLWVQSLGCWWLLRNHNYPNDFFWCFWRCDTSQKTKQVVPGFAFIWFIRLDLIGTVWELNLIFWIASLHLLANLICNIDNILVICNTLTPIFHHVYDRLFNFSLCCFLVPQEITKGRKVCKREECF